MYLNRIRIAFLSFITAFIFLGSAWIDTNPVEPPVSNTAEPMPVVKIDPIYIPSPIEIIEDEPEPEPKMSTEDIELIALVTMAEAEGEPEEGKRLVIDTVLNRVDGTHWPDTVKDVVYQPSQFSSMWNSRVDRCYVMEEICQLVEEELESRTNSEVVFFRTGHYSKYGAPIFKVGAHYFSSYD